MVELLAQGTRKARKRHQCFHCYRDIVPGQAYGFQTCKYDYVYTLAWHLDCEELANECRQMADDWGDEGWPPLRDMWVESGDGRYYASGRSGRRSVTLGRFERLEDAVAARLAWEKERGFHVNHGLARSASA